MLNALTIDVEDYFQVHAFESVIDRRQWHQFPGRVLNNTRCILELLEECKTHATFFILGWVAERHPELVREIADCGHEIATHGYWHELVYRQTPEEFTADLSRSLMSIHKAFASGDDQQGKPVIGYRAPCFSITQLSFWALDILQEHGIRYDSSIFPLVVHDRYGVRDANRFANQLGTGLWEFPVSTVRLFRRNWPVAGGGYFRFLPLWMTWWGIRRINSEGQPAVVYLHPWELDAEQPVVANASRISRFRHYVNLHKTKERLKAMLAEFQFSSIQEVFADYLGKH